MLGFHLACLLTPLSCVGSPPVAWAPPSNLNFPLSVNLPSSVSYRYSSFTKWVYITSGSYFSHAVVVFRWRACKTRSV